MDSGGMKEVFIFPLSFAQQRLWFLDQWEPGNSAYNIPFAVCLTGQLDVGVLEWCFNEIVQRHETLRTTFSMVEGQPVQVVAPALAVRLPVVDLLELSGPEQEAETRRLATEEAQQPFDLTRGPLLRATLLGLGKEQHVLLLTMHHIVSDGWSTGVFVREVAMLHQALMAGESSPLPELPIQYADFAVWQREWLQGDVLETQLTYWKQQLTGAPVLQLPADRSRPPALSFRGAKQPLVLSRSLTRALEALSEQEGVTLFMTLLAAFKTLLHRYTGQTDIVVGSPIANRNRSEIEGLIGFFVNTLALRTDLSGNPTFRGLLGRVREVALGAYAHQDLPFELLVEELRPERDMSRNPLFQVVFALQNAPTGTLELQGLAINPLELDSRTVRFDLELHVWEHPEGLNGFFVYNTDLFEAATIIQMVRHLRTLLEGIVTSPEQRLSELPLLTDTERHQLVVEWNDTQTDYPKDQSIHELFEVQVERTPDAVAVIFEDQHLTYRELNRRANQLAHCLSGLGVGMAVSVGICMERSLEMIVGLLGVLKVGGVYIPLEPTYPRERLTFLLEDAAAVLLLTQKRLLPRLPEGTLPVICLDADWKVAARESDANPTSKVEADSVAYVIYTSGSTGMPKGVVVCHRPVVNVIHWVNRTFGVGPDDRLLFTTSLCFDLSVYDIFGLLAAGGVVQVPLESDIREPGRLLSLLCHRSITFWDSAPAALQQLVPFFSQIESNWERDRLRLVFLSGDWIPLRLPDAIRYAFPLARVISLGGATEATIWSNYYPIGEIDPDWASIPYGKPIQNARYYILDPHLNPRPIGVPGDLYIGGKCLALCYFNQPGLTAEKFIPDPFGEEPGAHLYRTGDLARYRHDGNVEFLGRLDYQVKIRGFRVELEEIEAALVQHPALREAVVLAREDTPDPPSSGHSKRLVAYVVSNEGQSSTASELRRFLQEKLPDYMVPSAFVTLNALPLTPNGKVDRRALPAPQGVRPEMEEAFVAPRTPLEKKLATIWTQVLGVEQVGIHDEFFELGGHSLLAVQLVSQVHDAFQVNLPLRTLFTSPTVALLAAVIAQREAGQSDREPGVQLPTIVPDPKGRCQPFPLTDVQQAYWIGRSGYFELGNVATHVYLEFQSVALDLERLELAWQRLIERHDMLRAIVRPDGQQQILERVPPYQIKVLNLCGQDPDTVTTQLEAVRQRMSHQVLPSGQWPLFEICASRLDDGRTRLHVSLDALIGDAWSWQILIWELAQLYRDPETSFDPLELSFRDYVLAEMAIRQSELYQRSLEYWQSRLATLPPAPELPIAKNLDSLTHPHFVRRGARLEPTTWHQLKARAAQAGLTPSVVLLAAFAQVLAAWSKSPRFTINLTLFNRLPLHPQVNDIVGDFTSLTLLAVDHSPHDPFEVQARRLQEQLWEDLDHRYVSGVRVLREVAQMHDGAPRAAMPVVFTSALNLAVPDQGSFTSPAPSLLDQGVPDLIRLGEGIYSITQTPQVWLDHQVSEVGEALNLSWDAVEGLFPEGLLDDMFDAYCHLLQRLAGEQHAWQEAMQQLVPSAQLEQWAAGNATQEPVSGELLHTLFAAQVAQQPQQAAVIAPNRTLTYEDLYRRSNRIAHWLREGGVRQNTLVGVVMEKGWEQIVAVLGILQSGAAYLPIAADLPVERTHYLLAHGEVELTLTQSWLDERLAWPKGLQRLCVDSDGLEGMDEQSLSPVQRPEDLAYVIYTSGSTGLPKGVMIDHRGAVNTILDINRRFGVGTEDRVLALSSLSFDLSVYDIFGTLAAGGTIVVPDATAGRNPAHWAELVEQEGITVWNSVPALMEMLVECVNGRSERLPNSLRLILLSGDWIPVSLPDRIRALAEDVDVISLGGATEASIWSILYPIEEIDPQWTSIPYGRPMVNQSFHVLDGALEPRPVWVPGQLYIGGIGLAKGYWRDEGKTHASFVTCPRTGERLYRTGDLGRYLPDGNIEFLGREDFQVKLQGHRIELGEIEATLMQHPVVKAGVVTAFGAPRADQRLVAYVVLNQRLASTLDESQGLVGGQVFQDYQSPQAGAVLLDPLERLKFKLSHPGLRQEDGNRLRIQLVKPELDETLIDAYVSRRSYRRFEPQPISFERFSRFLSCLSQIELDGVPLPKHRYGSAGSLYPVQTYLYVKPDRVEGLPAGVYYYHPQEHQIVSLSAEARIDRSAYSGNQAVFDASAFALFFVGQLDAIRPMYGGLARDFCMLEAGLMTQLLGMLAPAHQIGLCQIGGFDFGAIRHWFALGEGHVYLHGLLGGPIAADQMRLQALVEDSGEFRSLLGLFQGESGQRGAVMPNGMTPSLTSPHGEEHGSDGAIVKNLQGFLREKLPEYMIPSAFVLLDALPLTPNGKVNRRALPAPDMIETRQEKTFVAPRTDLERAIATVWQEVLQVEEVSIHDRFFDLGGNSVHVVQAHNKLRESLGTDVPIVEMFEFPTIYALTRRLEQKQNEHSALQQSHDRARTREVLRQRRRQARQ